MTIRTTRRSACVSNRPTGCREVVRFSRHLCNKRKGFGNIAEQDGEVMQAAEIRDDCIRPLSQQLSASLPALLDLGYMKKRRPKTQLHLHCVLASVQMLSKAVNSCRLTNFTSARFACSLPNLAMGRSEKGLDSKLARICTSKQGSMHFRSFSP